MGTRLIRLLTHAAGPTFSLKAGQTIHLPVEVCEAMVAGGYAEYIDAEPTVAPTVESAPEAAVLEQSEAAVQPRARGRRRS